MKNNLFKVIFKDKNNQEIDLNYQLNDSILAKKWFKKIKHLKNVDFDKVESEQDNSSNLGKIYKEFCLFAGIESKNFLNINQKLLNDFHKLYEQHHEECSKRENNFILYRFHQAIHFYENKIQKVKYLTIGWGIKEGPLTELFQCNPYYETSLKKNNIYLPWSELGKRPFRYWRDQEASDQIRFNQLCKPHVTLRAKFLIPHDDVFTSFLPKEFIEWFAQYKKKWFVNYNINRWNEVDEQCAPLLAFALHSQELTGWNFVKILECK